MNSYFSCLYSIDYLDYSVHPPPPIYTGGLSILPYFKKGGAWQDLNF